MKAHSINKKSSAIYDIRFHIILVTKYRKNIFIGDIIPFLTELFHKIAKKRQLTIQSLSIQPDHVHFFLLANPLTAPFDYVKSFKGITGLRLFQQFPALKQKLYKGKLWSPSYWISTVGVVSSETIEQYIANQ